MHAYVKMLHWVKSTILKLKHANEATQYKK